MNDEDEDETPTLESIKDYLLDALTLDIDTDNYDDPIGFQNCELLHDTLVEVKPKKKKK